MQSLFKKVQKGIYSDIPNIFSKDLSYLIK